MIDSFQLTSEMLKDICVPEYRKCVFLSPQYCKMSALSIRLKSFLSYGRGRTSAFGVYIGHRICHSMLATSATLLSRPDITMSEGPKDQGLH